LTKQVNIPAQYAAWWRSLTPQDRRLLIARKLFDPSDLTGDKRPDRSRVNDGHFDFSRSEEQNTFNRQGKQGNLKTLTPSAAEEVAQAEEVTLASLDPRIEQLDLASFRLRAMLEFLLDGLDASTDPAMRLKADVIRIVVGEGRPPRMSELAKAHNLTRSAVSLQCRKLLRRMGLPPSRFMRPEDEVRTMRVAYLVRQARVDHMGAELPPKNEGKPRISRVCTPHTPGKESIYMTGNDEMRARPRKKVTEKRSFPLGKGDTRQIGQT
jgi:hypothetical protein